MTLDAKLVVVGGDVKTTEIKLRLPSTIGRGKSAGIVLPHPLVSRQHCELFESGGQLMVRDPGSAPLPLHLSHASSLRTSISFSAPNAASSSVICMS